MQPTLTLGGIRPLDGTGATQLLALPAHHLLTHGVVTGMTGSGKTGLLTVLVEEALRAQIPTLMIDVKGDLPNLGLAFPSFDPREFLPWIDPADPAQQGRSVESIAASLADERRRGLTAWGITEQTLADFRASTDVRVLTPGSTGGQPLHVLSALERRSPRWDDDLETARASLVAAVSLVLRLLGRDPDPARSREHVLLSVLAERRLRNGAAADLPSLLADLETPPMPRIGAMTLDAFLPRTARRDLAASLNALLASPSFSTWREGESLDVGAWLAPRAGRTPATIVSVAHLDDEERQLVLGVLLEEVLSWVRSRPGANTLRALVVFDEVYGFMPPHPAHPPTRRPLIALMKQARAFGVGVVLATQNPMDLDYRSLGNAGLWCVGRLQTDGDRARVVDGMRGEGGGRMSARELSGAIGRLGSRWFVLRDAHAGEEPVLLQPRHAMSWLRGPMTRAELRRMAGVGEVAAGVSSAGPR